MLGVEFTKGPLFKVLFLLCPSPDSVSRKQNLPLRRLCPVWDKGRFSQICGATEGPSSARCPRVWIPALSCSCPCLLVSGDDLVIWFLCTQERSDGGEEPCLCAHVVTHREKCPGLGRGVEILGRKRKAEPSPTPYPLSHISKLKEEGKGPRGH